MALEHHRVVITAAGRDFGRTLALGFAARGAEVHLSARSGEAARRVREEIIAQGHDPAPVHAHACDLTDPASVRAFAGAVAARTDHVDVLVNNGSRYQHGTDLLSASDEDIVDTLASGATGTVLATKAFLPLLPKSAKPDIVTMVSGCGQPGKHRSDAHDAFYAAKSAQAGFTESLSRRLRGRGVRVISLYPPDFANHDPLSPAWQDAPRTAQDPLTAQSLVDCVFFAIGQPRDCFIKSFYFEQTGTELTH
ncbi:SDR family oxidoreductase [Streptomyces racemochromogenes]|uniref:SDR family oxidoreductase n=1 Tax=Streptomyces racemochromogenes TaxID=67353 RepID=UPI0031ECCE8F